MTSATNVVDCQRELDGYIKELSGNEEEEGELTRQEPDETEHYHLNISDQELTCDGYAKFSNDPNFYGLHHFEIGLGPANSKRLIGFLLSLPPEPAEDSDHRLITDQELSAPDEDMVRISASITLGPEHAGKLVLSDSNEPIEVRLPPVEVVFAGYQGPGQKRVRVQQCGLGQVTLVPRNDVRLSTPMQCVPKTYGQHSYGELRPITDETTGAAGWFVRGDLAYG